MEKKKSADLKNSDKERDILWKYPIYIYHSDTC